jgi:hypothetical protein
LLQGQPSSAEQIVVLVSLHEAIEILDLERDRAACGVTRFFLGEVCESQAAAAVFS